MLIQEGVERVPRYEVGRYPVPKGAVPGTTGGGTRYQCKARYPVPVYVYVYTCRAVAVPTKGDGTRYEGAESDTRGGGYLVPERAVLGTIGYPVSTPSFNSVIDRCVFSNQRLLSCHEPTSFNP